MSSSYPHKGRSGTASSSPYENTASPNIINVMLWMKKEAYEDSTIKGTIKRLKHLKRNCFLADPENVKVFVANKKCTNGYKESLIEAYDIYMRSIGQKWNKPFYKRYDKLPKIPTEEKLNMIIANAGTRMSLILSMSKDLGTRPIELTWLKVADINLQNGVVNITGAKHTTGRNGRLKTATLEMLKAYINKKQLGQNNRIFPTKSENISELYRITGRKRFKLQKFEQPLDKILTPQELYFMRIAKELNMSPEEAYNLWQEVAKADDAEFMSSFSEIAKERGITPEEAYNQIMEETGKETEEFLFQIEKERIAELKELKQQQQTST